MAYTKPINDVRVTVYDETRIERSTYINGQVLFCVTPGTKQLVLYVPGYTVNVVLTAELSEALHHFTARPEGFGTGEDGNTYVKLSK